jgi:hypothetical protein
MGQSIPPGDEEEKAMKDNLCGLASFVIGLALLAVCPACADDKKPDRKGKREEASVWMKKKQEYAGKILTGLTKGDFEMIKTNAEAMQVVGYFEEWDRAERLDYRRQLRYFNDTNKELIRQAEKKNINGATLVYTQMVLSCVQCHNIIRDAK